MRLAAAVHARRRRLAWAMEGKSPGAMAAGFERCAACGGVPRQEACGACGGAGVVRAEVAGDEEIAEIAERLGEFAGYYAFLERHGMAGLVAVYGRPGEEFLEAVAAYDAELARLEMEDRAGEARKRGG